MSWRCCLCGKPRGDRTKPAAYIGPRRLGAPVCATCIRKLKPKA